MRFAASVDDERASATPVLLMHERAEASDVSGGIRASERRPQPVVEVASRELAVIDKCDQREGIDGRGRVEVPQELADGPLLLAVAHAETGIERRSSDRQNAGDHDSRIAKAVGQCQVRRNGSRQLAS